jgi:ribosomal 50S subunit-associated protein YjgA (DUF615 family)
MSARHAQRHHCHPAATTNTAALLALQADIEAAGRRFADVQSLKAYLADLADCLYTKAPIVEELADALAAAREEAAEAMRTQQRVRFVVGCV